MTVPLTNIHTVYIHNTGKNVKPKNLKHIHQLMNQNKSSKITAHTKDNKLKIIQIGYIHEEIFLGYH